MKKFQKGDIMVNNEIIVTLKVNCELSFWQAIKLRLAGKNFKIIAEEILKELKTKIVHGKVYDNKTIIDD